MAHQGEERGKFSLTRRDFLKASAATAAGVAGLGALTPAPASAYKLDPADASVTTFHTTCPYCSAQCGQLVDVGVTTGKVYDVYGDMGSPTNAGGLCAKGAGAYQLVTNARRLGVPWNTTGMTGTAWKRKGNADWSPIALDTAIAEIAGGDGGNHAGLVGIRGAISAGDNAAAVQFFGSSHINNEQNYLYRKLVADFGTSRIEHQARI
jgi:formate dehydrogenase major subunit